MNKGKSLTFYGLFDVVEAIEIPILQRDYAQGREEELEVRTLFLNSLFQALNNNDESHQPLDLDFVYGNFEEGERKAFSVLDGQQRLTTLFLLHWYLAIQHGHIEEFRHRFVTDEQRSRFTYKTRPSTTEFFDALTSKDMELSGAVISKQIKNSQWFYLSWQQDPTVQACLNMLDAIQRLCSQNDINLYERIINTSEPYITFQFLDLHSFGLSDELYIKMNARGKPLTIFENFKAKLEQKIKSFDGPWPEYTLPFQDSASGYDYFIHKVDTDWADLFWPYRNVCSDDDSFDDELMNFIRLAISYQYLIDNKDSPIELDLNSGELFGRNGRLEALTLSKYEELDCLNKAFIVRLISFLDLIYRNGLVDNKINSYLETDYYYAEHETLKRVFNNETSYDDKLRFYAFYSYVAKSPTKEELNEWLRVIFNLTENTIINTADEFNKALFAIDNLYKQDNSILETLANDVEITGFSGPQIVEEKIKAHLLLRSSEWRKAVISAEQHSFLKGQIGCILNFSEILSYYRDHKHCEWNKEEDNEYLNKFRRYSNAIQSVFDLIENSSASIDFLWERAVLSKGEYFTDKRGDKYNMLSSRDTRNNIPRDHSWKRLLRFGTSSIEQKQKYVKAVLDDPEFNPDEVKISLSAICYKAIETGELEPWRKALIQHKELMEYCKQGFIEKTNSEFVLLGQSQRNHTHTELFTKVLELELSEDKSQLAPFSHLWYVPVKSREESAHLKLSGFAHNGEKYQIEIHKTASCFDIRVKGGDIGNAPETLTGLLESEGFELNDMALPSLGFYRYYSDKNQKSIEDVTLKIQKLCTSLEDLSDE
ncbi:hypothetical protein GCM10025856_26050 [Methylophaga marina]|uniref:GmrSD restriction endonucleases N-terminal domain-containing protein n=1 Tax=Methylophaga marina TaxID=45495 RepID=A0ABP3DKL0_9GAMM|nr:DUF262 domain-containing protein [Methylophaga marina]BDZ74886.1 hypothetical protein GCM10025856_26050 [Methylophaga marina]